LFAGKKSEKVMVQHWNLLLEINNQLSDWASLRFFWQWMKFWLLKMTEKWHYWLVSELWSTSHCSYNCRDQL